MDFPWKEGVLNTAHKVLHTCVVILLPSYNDAYGCNDANGPPPSVVMCLGQITKKDPNVPKGV